MRVIESELDGVKCQYTLMNKLGEGGFSKVYKCERVMNGTHEIFAAKVFSRSFLRMQKTWSRVNDKMVYSTALEKVEREIALMKRLRHPNLVSLVDVIDDEEEDQIFMMLDFVENGQVMYYDPATYQFTSKLTGGVLPEDIAKRYLYDVVSGLKYLHLHKVVHRDIKPENILVSKDDHCKIADFGVAHIFDTMNSTDNSTQAKQGLPEATRPLHLLTRTATGLMTNTAGTTYFYPPECCQEQPYNAYAADIWALGVTLFIMVVGRFPLFNPDPFDFLDDLERKEIEIPTNLSLPLQDLLRKFLEKDPTKRISIDEILAHEWMKGCCPENRSSCDIPAIERSNLSTNEVRHAFSYPISSSDIQAVNEEAKKMEREKSEGDKVDESKEGEKLVEPTESTESDKPTEPVQPVQSDKPAEPTPESNPEEKEKEMKKKREEELLRQAEMERQKKMQERLLAEKNAVATSTEEEEKETSDSDSSKSDCCCIC